MRTVVVESIDSPAEFLWVLGRTVHEAWLGDPEAYIKVMQFDSECHDIALRWRYSTNLGVVFRGMMEDWDFEKIKQELGEE